MSFIECVLQKGDFLIQIVNNLGIDFIFMLMRLCCLFLWSFCFLIVVFEKFSAENCPFSDLLLDLLLDIQLIL